MSTKEQKHPVEKAGGKLLCQGEEKDGKKTKTVGRVTVKVKLVAQMKVPQEMMLMKTLMTSKESIDFNRHK